MTEERSYEKRPTIRDVARLAGVSRTTVSFVLNNIAPSNISAETRSRVHAAVRQLNYHPLEAARNLRNQATRTLGVALPDIHNPHYIQIVSGIDDYAQKAGYSLSIYSTNFSVERERLCLNWLQQRRNDALILLSGTGRTLLQEIRALHEHGYLITNLSFRRDNMFEADIDSVVPQPGRGERLILDHLIELGHRRIGYIYGVADHTLLDDRLNACLAYQATLNIPMVEAWMYRCGPTLDEGYAATRALVRSCPPDARPTALIVVNDLLAMGVLSALASEDVQVPSMMSVVSFDNIPHAAHTVPALTTVDYNSYLIGEHAARLTIERLARRDRSSVFLEVPAQLIIRRSTGQAPDF